MTPTKEQKEAIQRIVIGPDGDRVIAFYESVIDYYADVRRMKNLTNEELKARQLACDILKEEVVDRLKRSQGKEGDNEGEEYE